MSESNKTVMPEKDQSKLLKWLLIAIVETVLFFKRLPGAAKDLIRNGKSKNLPLD